MKDRNVQKLCVCWCWRIICKMTIRSWTNWPFVVKPLKCKRMQRELPNYRTNRPIKTVKLLSITVQHSHHGQTCRRKLNSISVFRKFTARLPQGTLTGTNSQLLLPHCTHGTSPPPISSILHSSKEWPRICRSRSQSPELMLFFISEIQWPQITFLLLDPFLELLLLLGSLQVRGCLLENLTVLDPEEETMPSWQEEHLETFVLLISLLEKLHQRLSTYHQAMFLTCLMLPKSMPRLELISSSWRAKITDVDPAEIGQPRDPSSWVSRQSLQKATREYIAAILLEWASFLFSIKPETQLIVWVWQAGRSLTLIFQKKWLQGWLLMSELMLANSSPWSWGLIRTWSWLISNMEEFSTIWSGRLLQCRMFNCHRHTLCVWPKKIFYLTQF